MSKKSGVETRGGVLRDAMKRKVLSRMAASADLVVPALPALVDMYEETLVGVFIALGRGLSRDERTHLHKTLGEKLEEAFAKSPHSKLRIAWRTDPAPAISLTWSITPIIRTMVDEFNEWPTTRDPPLFGKYPDQMVLEIAKSLGAPKDVACLDIGAGTGRNALPLAKDGYPVTAVEVAPELLRVMAADAKEAGATLNVIQGDALSVKLPRHAYQFAFLCEVVSHFREPHEVQTLFRNLVDAVAPGGKLLFSAFVAHEGYTPDKTVRNVSEFAWASVFTKQQILDAAKGTPFRLVREESVHDYEKARLPADGFPPTSWFVDWSLGRDVFPIEGLPPLSLRWLLFERT